MRIKGILILSLILAVMIPLKNGYSLELYDRVIAIVNESPIVEGDVMSRLKHLQKKRKFSKKKQIYQKSRIIDTLIENVIVSETAREISVIVSDDKVLNYIKKLMGPFFAKKAKSEVRKIKKELILIKKKSDRLVKQNIKLKKQIEKYEKKNQKRYKKVIEKRQKNLLANNKTIIVYKNNAKVLFEKGKLVKDTKELVEKIVSRLKNTIRGIKNPKNPALEETFSEFISYVERSQKINFYNFIDDIRVKMKKEHIISIAIGMSPPSREEAMKWYKKNRKKLGYEVRVKHILVRVKNRSIKEEKRANDKIFKIWKKARKSGFEKAARKYSEKRSTARNGGDLGWQMLATMDPYMAGHAFRLKRGQVSKPFRTNSGYEIVKLVGKKAVSFDKVKRFIMFKLYNEKMVVKFKKWVKRRKQEANIKIFMKNYIAEK